MALEKELATYSEKLPERIPNEGKFVLTHDDQIVDVYGTYEDATKEGYSKFGLGPFLVRQIHAVEQQVFVSRLVPRF